MKHYIPVYVSRCAFLPILRSAGQNINVYPYS